MASDRAPHPPLDPAAYGDAFADVYDDWYRDLGDPADVVRALDRLVPAAPGTGRTVVELGVGTGRLAVPLAEAGWTVVGLDSSPAMLAALDARIARAEAEGRIGAGSIAARLADVTTEDAWPNQVDVVLASFNLLLNLPDARAQGLTVHHAAGALRPGGVLVCETQVLDLKAAPAEASAVRDDGVRIETTVDAEAGVVSGRHVDPTTGVVRPWRLCALHPAHLDEMAATAGLVAEARWSDWAGSPFVPDDAPTSIAIYRRPRP